jgi:hypothetical protein
MILISHRGNTLVKDPALENHPNYILNALSLGYDVEIDIWKIKDKLYLGHDEPQYDIDLGHEIFNWDNRNKLWIHCKNIPTVHYLLDKDLNIFFHDKDQCVLTSKGYIWTYPGYSLGEMGKENKSICVLPETVDYEEFNCVGICSDVIGKYKGHYDSK